MRGSAPLATAPIRPMSARPVGADIPATTGWHPSSTARASVALVRTSENSVRDGRNDAECGGSGWARAGAAAPDGLAELQYAVPRQTYGPAPS